MKSPVKVCDAKLRVCRWRRIISIRYRKTPTSERSKRGQMKCAREQNIRGKEWRKERRSSRNMLSSTTRARAHHFRCHKTEKLHSFRAASAFSVGRPLYGCTRVAVVVLSSDRFNASGKYLNGRNGVLIRLFRRVQLRTRSGLVFVYIRTRPCIGGSSPCGLVY